MKKENASPVKPKSYVIKNLVKSNTKKRDLSFIGEHSNEQVTSNSWKMKVAGLGFDHYASKYTKIAK